MSGKYDIDPGQTKGQKGFINQFNALEDLQESTKKSLRASFTSVEKGSLKIRGGLFQIMGNDGDTDIVSAPGAQPLIAMYPKGALHETHAVIWYATDNPVLPGFADQATQLYIGRIADSIPDGGKVLVSRRFAIFSHQPYSDSPYSTLESFIWIGREISSMSDKGFSFQGKWPNYGQYASSDALLMGSVSVGAGFTSQTVLYSGTFDTSVWPVVTLLNSGGAVTWCLTSQSTGGFTVAWSGTAAKVINFWVFRTA